MEATTAPTARQNDAGLWLCPSCDAFPYFTEAEAIECAMRHGASPVLVAPAEPVLPTTQRPGVKADECRWAKLGTGWGVRGPARILTDGATITVTKANGATSEVTIGVALADAGNRWDTEPMAIGQPADSIKAQTTEATAPTEVPKGIHRVGDEIYKVVIGKTGNRYAKVLQGEKFAYQAGAIRKLSAATALSLEEAKAIGRATGTCCCCGTGLEDPKSVAKGIGPWCEKNYF